MSNNDYATIKEIAEYGLDKIPADKTVAVNLRDFMYIYRALEEYMRFFHNPDHYPTINDIKDFLGDVSSGGAFEVFSTAIYKIYNMNLPDEIQNMLDDGVFEHTSFPEYYKDKSVKPN